jgi:hypothetical protein
MVTVTSFSLNGVVFSMLPTKMSDAHDGCVAAFYNISLHFALSFSSVGQVRSDLAL